MNAAIARSKHQHKESLAHPPQRLEPAFTIVTAVILDHERRPPVELPRKLKGKAPLFYISGAFLRVKGDLHWLISGYSSEPSPPLLGFFFASSLPGPIPPAFIPSTALKVDLMNVPASFPDGSAVGGGGRFVQA